ncbi:MAG: thiolase domain-containing protein [Deltaproteobacteria bacterium]|nr:thiolase domain-containing protein [Deltaproteobacteria bacterium]
MRRVAVVGIGHSRFGVRSDASLRELAFESVKACLQDAGVTLEDVDAMVTSVAGDEFAFSLQPSAQVHDYIGFHPKPNFRVEGACASGSMALRTGWMTVASGLAHTVLVVGVEKMTEVPTSVATDIMGRGGDAMWEYPFGMTFPGYYAMLAQAHMAEFGTTERHLAMVAVKNHYYGSLNPMAHMQKEVALEKALSSFTVAYPLKLYDCSLITDGSASVLLASEQRAREISSKPVWIAGLGLATDTMAIGERKSLTSLRAAEVAAQQAYEMSGLGPSDIDVATVHDCFTIAEIVAYEDLGFCSKGEGWKLIEEGETYAEGRIPVNLDGGLKSKGHPIGATGVSMAVEITKQLRGEAEKHQARNAEIGLTHNVGGSGQVAAVHIFRGD